MRIYITSAYAKIYLEGAMIRLGDMLEYACLDCGYDPDAFWKMFLDSGIAWRFGIGEPAVVAGMSGPELAYIIMHDVDQKSDFPTPSWREERSDLYWCGWVLAYFQWYENMSFASIWENISIRTLQKMYPALHEADISKAVDEMKALIKPIKKTPVRTLRIVRGLTQKELAERAHMAVSQLQRVEYGDRKVENLTLKTALALANALGVKVEALA